jgi:hypothetical protein
VRRLTVTVRPAVVIPRSSSSSRCFSRHPRLRARACTHVVSDTDCSDTVACRSILSLCDAARVRFGVARLTEHRSRHGNVARDIRGSAPRQSDCHGCQASFRFLMIWQRSRRSARADAGRQVRATTEPPPDNKPRLGGVDHRTAGWLELLPQAAGTNHHATRHGVFPCNQPRKGLRNYTATKSENRLARKRGPGPQLGPRLREGDGELRRMTTAGRTVTVNRRTCFVSDPKLAHGDGGPKARFFLARGFTVDAWDVPQASMIIQGRTNTVTRSIDTE